MSDYDSESSEDDVIIETDSESLNPVIKDATRKLK